ncbi:MAG: hypothetical protein K9M00_01600 [Candidatus Omnitrophica bacterium]|nr:hypothetical protein [Candidatus Omnitrophota bacterium]
MDKKDLGKTSIGMQPNVAGLLCYLAGWVTGFIFFLIEKENKFVRFHAMQAIILSVALIILMFIPFVNLIAALVGFVLWIVMMVTAFQGKKVKIPFAANIAEKNA